MENRERDRVSQRDTPTEAGQVNKRTEEERMHEKNASSAEFGSSIGRSEHLEGGERDRDKNRNDSTPRSGSKNNSGNSGMGGSSSERH